MKAAFAFSSKAAITGMSVKP